MKIKVVDDSMGSFKSSSAIKMIHESVNKSWVVVTPYLDEIDIFKNPTKEKHNRGFLNLKKTISFSEPEHLGWGKLKSLKDLMVLKKNIATTHALFKYADDELVDIIKANDYTLVLDEVMEVIQPIQIKKKDIQKLMDDGVISVDDVGCVSFNEGTEYYSRYEDVISTIKTGRVVSTGESFLLWCFPLDVMEAFNDIYILTYMFDGSLMKAYLDTFNVEYEYFSVDKENVNDLNYLVNLPRVDHKSIDALIEKAFKEYEYEYIKDSILYTNEKSTGGKISNYCAYLGKTLDFGYAVGYSNQEDREEIKTDVFKNYSLKALEQLAEVGNVLAQQELEKRIK